MTKIIGHRGAAGLALENTLAAFQTAINIGVKTYEFDVHVTKDGHFVVCHDDHLGRVSDSDKRIKDLTYAGLQTILLHNGAPVPLLTEVLDLARARSIAVVVEVKIRTYLSELCELLDTYNDLNMVIASFKYDTLTEIRQLRPSYHIYVAEKFHPIEVLFKARKIKAQGIDLNHWLINPITYWAAQAWGLQVMIFTIDNRLVGRFLTFFYPNIALCTNHPQRFLRRERRRPALTDAPP